MPEWTGMDPGTEPDRDGRLGILGGTFDPIHIGHLVAAQAVHERLGLDRTLLIPAGSPPHKGGEGDAPPSLRLRMVRAAVEGDDRFHVSDQELRREGPSFTVDTLEEIRGERPDVELFLIMGADQWADFGSWKDPDRILGLAGIVVMTRSGEDAGSLDPELSGETFARYRHRIVSVPVPRVDLSSTEIRERLRQGVSVRYMVPESVRRILEASKLYL